MTKKYEKAITRETMKIEYHLTYPQTKEEIISQMEFIYKKPFSEIIWDFYVSFVREANKND